ncbi:MAG: class I SAM-dependent methyltransferase [Flavobacteriaceae bacterium]|nr:class I SAM-dependent methyltransferase [Flavobacteriaceae bacterium]
MDFISAPLQNYIAQHSQQEPKILQDLNRETWQKVLIPRMLSGAYQGRLLALLSKLIRPKTILEIGTYTGYSALCLAEGLAPDGALHTIDHNEELASIQQKYFNKSAYKNKIKTYLGEALDIIENFEIKFDLAFIDADKVNYPNYFKAIVPKMNTGGLILSDNVLWSGKVLQQADAKDKDTQALQNYNKLLNDDPRVESILLPIRDGLMLTRVK